MQLGAGQMSNVLVRLIHEGKIRTLQDLKSAYHTLVMKTHLDAVGSERHLESYLELSSPYWGSPRVPGQRRRQAI
jgi:hypothetical protein